MTDVAEFDTAFHALTGHGPFPWQELMYEKIVSGNAPSSCDLPTGLGKTSVIPIWLIALANNPAKVLRRLVYIVNRRTVVDQATNEAEKIRDRLNGKGALSAKDRAILKKLQERLARLSAGKHDEVLAISTLRGQFADNAEWRADPARPAIVIGTIDMIGSRLLFSGYGRGFKSRPLHAGFLGQDVLLMHDEAHLEPAFQDLLMAIEQEQREGRTPDFRPCRVVELSATSRRLDKPSQPSNGANPFELTPEEKSPPERLPDKLTRPVHFVWQRLKAKKRISFHTPKSEKETVADRIGKLAKNYVGKDSGKAILVYVGSLKDHAAVCKALRGQKVQVLTGTLRGLERDRMADPRKETGCPIFARFLKPPQPDSDEKEGWEITPTPGTVFLVCTSAGEVGIDISADHLVCDLVAFERMAQRFGRVNRFGTGDANIDVVYEAARDKKKDNDPNDQARWKTLELLRELPLVSDRRSASPLSLMQLRSRNEVKLKVDAAYSPKPTVLPVSDILFDAWALTTVKGKLPGRPPVEPYLHGVEDHQQAETYVAWRDEVWLLREAALTDERITELLDNYPLKPHELLRDNTYRKKSGVRDQLAKLGERQGDLPVWIQELGGDVHATTLGKVAELSLAGRTVILPPEAGGLLIADGQSRGLLDGAAEYEPTNRCLYDVADVMQNTEGHPLRLRQRTVGISAPPKGMRRVAAVRVRPQSDEEDEASSSETDTDEVAFTHLQHCSRPESADDDSSKTSRGAVAWEVHTKDVTDHAERIVARLPLPEDVKKAVILAAKLHDLGKLRAIFQRLLGNTNLDTPLLAKSGGKTNDFSNYRHEFGSLLDVLNPDQSFLAELQKFSAEIQDLVLHLIATHHGRARPHFPTDEAFDHESPQNRWNEASQEVPRRFARLQRKYGRWGLAYLESLLRAADWAASAGPSANVEEKEGQS